MVDVDGEHSGAVIDKLTGSRKGSLVDMRDSPEGKVSLRRSSRPSIECAPWGCSPVPPPLAESRGLDIDPEVTR